MSETGFEGAATTKGSRGGEWPEHTVCHLGVQWTPVNTCLSTPVHTSSTWWGSWASQCVFFFKSAKRKIIRWKDDETSAEVRLWDVCFTGHFSAHTCVIWVHVRVHFALQNESWDWCEHLWEPPAVFTSGFLLYRRLIQQTSTHSQVSIFSDLA